jgi:NAD(P)H dehydrogenase (quinone)
MPHPLLLRAVNRHVFRWLKIWVCERPEPIRTTDASPHHLCPPHPRSFCHAVLARFTQGLRDAGHTSEVVDLYAIGFDPVFRDRDGPDWVDDSVPDDVLAQWNLRRSLVEGAPNPVRRLLVKRWIGDRDGRELVRRLHALGAPRDVAEQQALVARADALAFVAPVCFVGFPAILKGWIERVFSLGFAFGMTADAWRGELAARVPLLTHAKALVIQTTIWDAASYDSGLKAAMQVLVDEYALRFPGIKQVEYVYFHAVNSADDATRQGYLERAYLLGRGF